VVQIPARCGLAILSGLVYAMAFPPAGWRWLVLPGLVGFLASLHGQHGTRARVLGLLFGYAAFAVGLSWVWNIFAHLSVALWAVMAAFPAAFAHFQGRAFLRGISGWKLAAFTALNWGAWEFIRAEIMPLKFPWMTAGLAIGPNVLLPWIGVYLVGFTVVFATAALTGRMWKIAGAALAALIAAVLLPRPHPAPAPGDRGVVKVAGVQLENVTIDDLIKATKAMPDGLDHVVWPEYAVPYDIRENKRDWQLLLDLCREKDITLTFGTQSRPGGGDAWRNIAITMDATGFLGEHTKVHTVHMFDDGTPGKFSEPVATPFGKVGTPICFDCDYEGIARKMTAAGAGYFVVPTMDAESWSARQHDQHAELARIRAAENGRWMFVVATSGVSQIIDPNGHIHARLGSMEHGLIRGAVKRQSRLTFYTRFGWLIAWCVLGFAAVAWIRLLIPVRKHHADGADQGSGLDQRRPG
jgi:apolipoprotein N-acyltransferase